MRKWLFFTLLGLSIIFFIVSLISWNLLLGACSFVIAIGLTRFLDDAGITGRYSSKEVKKEFQHIRSQKPEVKISEGVK